MKSFVKWIYFLLLILISIVFLSTCDQLIENPKTYSITYDANNATLGSVPADQTKTYDQDVTLATNSGSLVRTGYTFGGWNTEADGSGTDYAEGAIFTINEDTTLYAKWDTSEYTITYNANGATKGSVPAGQTKKHNQDLTLATNSGNLGCSDYRFGGWNTEADGSGTTFAEGATFTIDADTTLYVRWRLPEVGDIGQAGGYIFYDRATEEDWDGTGWRYLEAAPEGWSEEEEDPKHVFGYYRTDNSGGEYIDEVGTQTGIGTGKSNTEKLVATIGDYAHYLNSGNEIGIYAAKVAWDYSIEVDGIVYDDWFLPSKYESNEMYKNLHLQNLGGFSIHYYWSSSEYYSYAAWSVYITNGSLSMNPRYEPNGRVRPVRRF